MYIIIDIKKKLSFHICKCNQLIRFRFLFCFTYHRKRIYDFICLLFVYDTASLFLPIWYPVLRTLNLDLPSFLEKL